MTDAGLDDPMSLPDSPRVAPPPRPVTSMGVVRSGDGPGGGSPLSPEPQPPRPATSAGHRTGSKVSITGMNLGSGLGVQGLLLRSEAGSRASFVSGRSSTTPGPGIGERMADKYFQEVRSCVDRHKGRSKTPQQVRLPLPLDSQGAVARPRAESAMSTRPRSRLGTVDSNESKSPGRKPRAGTTDSWGMVLEHDNFKQQMELRLSSLNTGNFEESYGIDGKHTGQYLYGFRHGKGTNQFKGEVYEGEWKWDKRSGWGALTLRDGSKAEGNFKEGRLHGFATLTDKDGMVVFEGEFQKGRRHGLGRQIFDSGDCYDGGWEDGRFQDRGVYYFTNGDKFYGMWTKGVYHGPGVFHYVDGSVSRRTYDNGIITSVQDYECESQRFGMPLTRDEMHKHTRDAEFPKNVFLLHTI